MFGVLALLGLVLLQEPVRIQQDAQAKQRLQEADQHFRLGTEALHTERFEEAEQEFRQAVKLDPNFFLAYYSLGRTYIALKDYDASVRAYLSCRQAWDRSMADEARQSFEQGSRREDKIREYQDKIRELEGQLRTATTDAARQPILARIQNIQVGIDALERARGIDGTVEPPAEFSLALGSAYLRAGSIDDAERAYREALQLRPKYGEAHNNLAVICIKRGDYDEAYAHVQAAQKAGFRVHPQLVSDIETGRRAAHK